MKLRLFTPTGAMPIVLATVAGATVVAGVVATALYTFQPAEASGKGAISLSAPSPIVGIGIPSLVIVGGYLWVRRRSSGRRTQI